MASFDSPPLNNINTTDSISPHSNQPIHETLNTNTIDIKNAYSIVFTNVHYKITIQHIYQECIFLGIGEPVQIVLCTFFPIATEESHHFSSIATVYLNKPNKSLIRHLETLPEGSTFIFEKLECDKEWIVTKNEVTNHFRIDHYEEKRILIQSLNSNKSGSDVVFLFREHGEMEQVDLVWVKTAYQPIPTRVQAYLYPKEWVDELSTYKLLDELNNVGVFTVKYEYNNQQDLLWIYELRTIEEDSTDFGFNFGQYPRWFPEDDEKYGHRNNKYNKLNWLFSNSGKFAYSDKIVDDEIMIHGGIFVGPDNEFYKIHDINIELEKQNWQPSTTFQYEEYVDESEIEIQQASKLAMKVIEYNLRKKAQYNKDNGIESEAYPYPMSGDIVESAKKPDIVSSDNDD